MDADRRGLHALTILALLVALVGARPFAAGWNDGSRLATVESLVDHGTWIIDDSIYIRPPADAFPYQPDDIFSREGTDDKILVDGHWYSDKPPLVALWLAFAYKVLQTTTGLVARAHPGVFAYVMTLLSSGLAYVIAVRAIDRLGQIIGLERPARWLLVAGFALATLAFVYVRSVNNHIVFLAVTSLMAVELARVASGDRAIGRWLTLGLLASMGYGLDLGAGPPLVLAVAAIVAYRGRGFWPLACYFAAAFPLFALHHVLNYRVGGTFFPANSVPEYVQWPGNPFGDMTGRWQHQNAWRFVSYAFQMLFGKSGFMLHNLPLLVLSPGAIVLLKRRPRELPEIVLGFAGCVGMWLVYAVGSRNYSGGCCSIRWFVPALGPAFVALAVLLRDHPRLRGDFALLSAGGSLLMIAAWTRNLWPGKMVPGFWIILPATLLAWAMLAVFRRARTPRQTPIRDLNLPRERRAA